MKDKIKAGETYNVRVRVIKVDEFKNVRADTVDENGKRLGVASTVFYSGELRAFSPITLENAPKYYDPCRKFRKGDNVSPCFWYDRPPTAYDVNEITAHFIPEKGLYSVSKDELPDSTVLVEYKGKIISMQACHLELINPVEVLKPYFVGESETSYDIFRKTSNGNQLRSSFWWKHNPTPELIELSKANAKAAAGAECARLNAEHRKEMGK